MIVTHSGHFHCDEVTAVAVLKCIPEFADFPVVRSRDPSVVEKAVIVVDVGGKYDPSTNRFDHHQNGFEETFDEYKTTKLSSAGLVYKHYGRRLFPENVSEKAYRKVYTDFFEPIDATDNGMDVGCVVSATNLWSRISWMNPQWNEKDAKEDDRFAEAVEIVKRELLTYVTKIVYHWAPAEALVATAVAERTDENVLVFPCECPFAEYLHDIEDATGIRVEYVISNSAPDLWKVLCVNDRGKQFESRRPLPQKYRGLSGQSLIEASGIPDAVFVHASGFIGSARSYEGARMLVEG